MEDFITKFNQKFNGIMTTPSSLEFYGIPDRMPQEELEEMIYKYQYTGSSLEHLAAEYRVTPKALTDYLERNEITKATLESDEEVAIFDTETNSLYKRTRIRLSGLIALHTAKMWRRFATTEENLLMALEGAAKALASSNFVDPKTLAILASAYSRLSDRHDMIKNALVVPHDKDQKGVVDALAKRLEDILNEIDGSVYELPSAGTNERTTH